MHAQTDAASRWVDSIYNQLTVDERIAQLMIVRANQPDKPYRPEIDEWIEKYNIGGVTFFKGKPASQVYQTNRWQQKARTPLLVSIDAEWGLAMRLSETVSYPFQMTLGAVQNDSLLALMGQQIADQCKRMGIHINFAPVADVNSNPENPVIGVRSFGNKPETVANKGLIYARALQNNGIIATAKHFPGHGDTKNDSHYSLPLITHSRAHFDSVELKPFRYLIENGIEGIMMAHLHIPALDSTKNMPSSLSHKIVTGLLKNELGFKGLIITDGLDMKGVTSVQPPGKIELMALKAGNDLLLLPENVPLAITTIKLALEKGEIDAARIEESCKKVLMFKYKAGLNLYRPAPTENLEQHLNKPAYTSLCNSLFDASITVLHNRGQLLPLKSDTTAWALVSIGKNNEDTRLIQQHLPKLKVFYLDKNADKASRVKLREQLKSYGNVIVNIRNTNINAQKNFGITDGSIAFVNELSTDKNIILNLFASPYALDLFQLNEQFKSILIGYQDRPEAVDAVFRVLTGALAPTGKLPVSLKSGYQTGAGEIFDLSLLPPSSMVPAIPTSPEPAGDLSFLREIDSIALDGIKKKAYPGCQIVALHQGKVIYNKAFGYLTYDNTEPVSTNTIYDLASLTKMLATTLVVMKLYEDSLLFLSETLGDYLPYLNRSDKGQLRLFDVLTHQSGLDGWIPFYLKTLRNNAPDTALYKPVPDAAHPYKVAENLYLDRKYRYIMMERIADSKLKKKEYRYSDLGFILLPTIIELITNKPFDELVYNTFYEPMQLNALLFQPLRKYPRSVIAPTENDQEFRKQLLRGDVHDPAAAMLGGISGHAGLFGTASDVSQIMQMLLNKGTINGQQFLKESTVDFFTKTHFKNNRRGIGFDKPPIDTTDTNRSMAMKASAKSFGHTGFTGTFAWADPENQLVVVFLSNRVYPDAKTNTLAKLGTRPMIHERFYSYVQSLSK